MRKLAFFSVVCAAAVIGGCELIADFDRSKIPTDAADAGDAGQVLFPDAAVLDAQMDGTTFDGSDGATRTDDGGDGGTVSDAGDGGG